MALFRSTTPAPMAKQRPAAAVNPAEQHNIIGKSTTIEGALRSEGNVNILGTVVGNVEVDGRTMLMSGGLVDGEVVSTSAEIGGTVRGQVSVRERLVLKATAVIEGDVRAGTLVVEDGASFNGRCEMGPAVSRGDGARSAEARLPDGRLAAARPSETHPPEARAA